MLSVSDTREVPKWRTLKKEYQQHLRRKCTPKEKKKLQDAIDTLDFYIFMAGSTYSINPRGKNAKQ